MTVYVSHALSCDSWIAHLRSRRVCPVRTKSVSHIKVKEIKAISIYISSSLAVMNGVDGLQTCLRVVSAEVSDDRRFAQQRLLIAPRPEALVPCTVRLRHVTARRERSFSRSGTPWSAWPTENTLQSAETPTPPCQTR